MNLGWIYVALEMEECGFEWDKVSQCFSFYFQPEN